MSNAIEAALRGAGLTDKPGEFDSSIHSWRCEHPETYGPCDCFQELVRELAEVERAAAARALEEFADQMTTGFNAGTLNAERRAIKREARARAEAYRQERGEQ